VPNHVLTDAGLADIYAEFEQFAVNVWSSPEWILAAQHPDQLANLLGDRWATGFAAANLPSPEQSEAFPVPGNHGFRFDDDQRTSPIGPNFTYPNPEESISGYQFRPFDRTLQNAELVPQGQNLELESRSASKRAEYGSKERR